MVVAGKHRHAPPSHPPAHSCFDARWGGSPPQRAMQHAAPAGAPQLHPTQTPPIRRWRQPHRLSSFLQDAPRPHTLQVPIAGSSQGRVTPHFRPMWLQMGGGRAPAPGVCLFARMAQPSGKRSLRSAEHVTRGEQPGEEVRGARSGRAPSAPPARGCAQQPGSSLNPVLLGFWGASSRRHDPL